MFQTALENSAVNPAWSMIWRRGLHHVKGNCWTTFVVALTWFWPNNAQNFQPKQMVNMLLFQGSADLFVNYRKDAILFYFVKTALSTDFL